MNKYEEQRRFNLKIGQPDFEIRSPSEASEARSESDSTWPLLNQVAKMSRGEPMEPPSDWHLPDTADFGEDDYRWHPGREPAPREASVEPAARAPGGLNLGSRGGRAGAGRQDAARAPRDQAPAPRGPDLPVPGVRERRAPGAAVDGARGGMELLGGRRRRPGPTPLRQVATRPAGHRGTPLKSLLKDIAGQQRRPGPNGERP